MTISLIRSALETRLLSITPAMSTALENVPFTPASGVPYQRSNLLPNTPDDGQMASSVYFEKGIFQVMICFPIGTGPGAAEARAQLVKNAFKRGTTLVQSGVTVIIMNQPSVASAMIEEDRFCIPISVRYQSQLVAP